MYRDYFLIEIWDFRGEINFEGVEEFERNLSRRVYEEEIEEGILIEKLFYVKI